MDTFTPVNLMQPGLLNLSLILNIVLALVIVMWVLAPLHRLLSTFIYRHFMMWRECRARRLAQEKQAGAQPHEKH